MKYLAPSLLIILSLSFTCQKTGHQVDDLEYQSLSQSAVPNGVPLPFREDLVDTNHLIHRGVLSPDLKHFYYTISNKNYTDFTIKSIHKIDERWSKPQNAFFNSTYDDHGMSFSPDGNSIYFSSTRPVDNDSIPNTWHIWRMTKVNGQWSEPAFIDIPNLRTKLVSHPTISSSGRIYFHASNLDYSNMKLFYSDPSEGSFQDAQPVFNKPFDSYNKCTPFISPNEEYIIYAQIQEELKLMISYKNSEQNWSKPIGLNELINQGNKGNPFVTTDSRFLFFAAQAHDSDNWKLKWVNMDDIGKNGG